MQKQIKTRSDVVLKVREHEDRELLAQCHPESAESDTRMPWN